MRTLPRVSWRGEARGAQFRGISTPSSQRSVERVAMDSFDATALRHCANTRRAERDSVLRPAEIARAWETVTRWEGYAPTALVSLAGLAGRLGIASLWYKDEGPRFGLGSFKALGGAYGVHRVVLERLNAHGGPAFDSVSEASAEQRREATRGLTIASATDGNHGRSVAWGARRLGCRCVIYIHAHVSEGREQALREQHAEVFRVRGNYDESVRQCAQDAEEHGWVVVSDTSYPGYREIPTWVMEGYTVMAKEIVDQLSEDIPTHVFVPGGVGGIAASLCEVFRHEWGSARPRFIVVEPELAACLFASARAGEPTSVGVEEETIMAGLSCGEVSMVAWEVLSAGADDFLTIPDALVAPSMRLLAEPLNGDPAIVAGESAVAGLAAVVALHGDGRLSRDLGLDESSRVLLIGTEGATDPVIYEQIVGRSAAEVVSKES